MLLGALGMSQRSPLPPLAGAGMHRSHLHEGMVRVVVLTFCSPREDQGSLASAIFLYRWRGMRERWRPLTYYELGARGEALFPPKF